LLVLAHLRKGETFADLAAGFGHRYLHRLAVCRVRRWPCRPPGAEAFVRPR
jgi:hypothetical protein